MSIFTWLNGYKDTIHICSCDDISATAEIDTINGIHAFYTKKRTPLMTNSGKTISANNLDEHKKECEEYLTRIHLDFNLKEHKMTNENQTKDDIDLKDLIITKDDLKQLKVLDKPTDIATRLAWIMRTVAYEYSRGKKGCCIPLREIGLMAVFGKEEIQELINILTECNYKSNFVLNKELIGHCLEIVWG